MQVGSNYERLSRWCILSSNRASEALFSSEDKMQRTIIIFWIGQNNMAFAMLVVGVDGNHVFWKSCRWLVRHLSIAASVVVTLFHGIMDGVGDFWKVLLTFQYNETLFRNCYLHIFQMLMAIMSVVHSWNWQKYNTKYMQWKIRNFENVGVFLRF